MHHESGSIYAGISSHLCLCKINASYIEWLLRWTFGLRTWTPGVYQPGQLHKFGTSWASQPSPEHLQCPKSWDIISMKSHFQHSPHPDVHDGTWRSFTSWLESRNRRWLPSGLNDLLVIVSEKCLKRIRGSRKWRLEVEKMCRQVSMSTGTL